MSRNATGAHDLRGRGSGWLGGVQLFPTARERVHRLRQPKLDFNLFQALLSEAPLGLSVRNEHLRVCFANKSWLLERLNCLNQGGDRGFWRSFLRHERAVCRLASRHRRPVTKRIRISTANGKLRYFKLFSFPHEEGEKIQSVLTLSIESAVVRTGTNGDGEKRELLAHDVRNHAFAIDRALETVIAGGAASLNPDFRRMLGASRKCCNQLLELATGLGGSGNVEVAEEEVIRRPLRVLDLLRESIHQCEGFALSRKVRLKLPRSHHDVRLWGNVDRLKRVLVNLLMNAIKYSPAGHDVRVMFNGRKAHELVIGVIDHGPGIPPKHRNEVFHKHFRHKTGRPGAVSGQGIGLYFCRKVIEAHGGSIWIEAPGGRGARGTCVYFKLPKGMRERCSA